MPAGLPSAPMILTRITTRSLLDRVAEATPGDGLALGTLIETFRLRGFGLAVLVAALPLFVPLPVGTGAISGPLVMLLGLQILVLREHPWLPARVSAWRLKQSSVLTMQRRLGPWLDRLERVSHPRLGGCFDGVAARVFTGLLLVLVGLLAALPIPFTNYPFGLLLALFAVAMIERDGVLMLLAWLIGLATVVATVVLWGEAWQWVSGLLA